MIWTLTHLAARSSFLLLFLCVSYSLSLSLSSLLLQSPIKGARGGDRRRTDNSYRELDLDGMDAEEYPVLGLRNTSMPTIPGLTSYIERPSPRFSSRSLASYAASPSSGSPGGGSATQMLKTDSPFSSTSRGYGNDSISNYLSGGGSGTGSGSGLVDQVYVIAISLSLFQLRSPHPWKCQILGKWNEEMSNI